MISTWLSVNSGPRKEVKTMKSFDEQTLVMSNCLLTSNSSTDPKPLIKEVNTKINSLGYNIFLEYPTLLEDIAVFTLTEGNINTANYYYQAEVEKRKVIPLIVNFEPHISIKLEQGDTVANIELPNKDQDFEVIPTSQNRQLLILIVEGEDFTYDCYYQFHEISKLPHRNLFEAVITKDQIGEFFGKKLFNLGNVDNLVDIKVDNKVYYPKGEKVTYDGENVLFGKIGERVGSLMSYTYDKRSGSLLGREIKVGLESNAVFQNTKTGVALINLKEFTSEYYRNTTRFEEFIPFKEYKRGKKVSIRKGNVSLSGEVTSEYEHYISLETVRCQSPITSPKWRKIKI